MKFVLGLLLYFTFLGVSEAASSRCESLFAPTAGEIFFKADKEVLKIRPQAYKPRADLEGLSWNQKRRIRNLLKDMNFETLQTEQQIIIKVQELNDLIFSKNETVDSYILRSKAQRESSTEQRLLFENLVREGMVSVWKQYGSTTSPTAATQFKAKATQLLSSRVFDLLMLPWMLPKAKSENVPETLIKKIILEGFDRHSVEFQSFVKSKSRMEAYQVFRKLYAPIVIGTVLVVQAYTAYELIQQQQEQELQKLLQGLRDQQKDLPNQVQEVQRQLFQEALSQALSDFRAQWGESPTATEEAKIREKIAAVLNINLKN